MAFVVASSLASRIEQICFLCPSKSVRSAGFKLIHNMSERKSTSRRASPRQNNDASTKSSKQEGIMMILSPAKTLDLTPYEGSLETTMPSCDSAKTLEVTKAMKSRSEKELTKLLSISASLGKTASEYWKSFEEKAEDAKDSKPCIYAFSGIAYQGLQIHKCSDNAVLYLQNNLRIIDPLYGALRPLDKIQAYRLEMATKGVFPKDKKLKLHEYWSDSVTASLAKDLEDRERKMILNLASDEYSSALNESGLPSGTQYVKIIFHDDGRVVTVHAKRARGLMTRFVAEHQCQTLDDVKKFDYEGYAFCESKSDDLCLVFQRTKIEAQKRKAAASGAASKKTKKAKK